MSIYQATALVIEAVRLRGGGDDDLGTVNPDAATATWLEVLTKLKWKLGPELTPAALDALLEPLKAAPFR